MLQNAYNYYYSQSDAITHLSAESCTSSAAAQKGSTSHNARFLVIPVPLPGHIHSHFTKQLGIFYHCSRPCRRRRRLLLLLLLLLLAISQRSHKDLRFFQTTPNCVTRQEGKQHVPSSSLLPFQSSPQSEKKKLGFPKKHKSKSSSIHTRRQRRNPQKKGQIPKIEGGRGGGMDSKSDGDGKCRGRASELEPANRAQFDQKRLDSNNDGWLLNELLHDWSHMDEHCSIQLIDE